MRQDCVNVIPKKRHPYIQHLLFCTGKSVSKDIEHIKDIIAGSAVFKEGFGRNEIRCNNIQKIISLWKDYLETFIFKNEKTCSSEKKLLLLVEL